ncbi:MAG TPA: RNA polymerase sigma factor [Polyangiaceae bacterium]|nr:RNA polymerase sigma factor [Polyangiaceae bacterium]
MATPLDSFASRGNADTDPETLSIERLKCGNLEALGELYDRHHTAVRAFACRLLGDASAAEDMVHEVFLGVPKAIRNFKGDSTLRTFLIAIAVNMSRHHVRAATRRRAAVERMAREPVRASGDPEGSAMREQAAMALMRALDDLSHDHRVAFVLCEVEERSSSEVAAIVGVPEGTVRTRVFHAKKKLRESLEAAGVR